MTIQIVSMDAEIEIPISLVVCPICGAQIFIEEMNEWIGDDEGRWVALNVKVDCSTAPDIDDDGWEDWFKAHWSTPYIDWLPVEQQVEEWLKANYRFEDADELPSGVTAENVRDFWMRRPDLHP